MKGDFSRWTADPWRGFGAVLMQQGRVQTDADWNEWVATTLRRARADSLDTLHPAFVSDETPDAFLVAVSGGTFTIGPGRMYVDGILTENVGRDPVVWDPRMEELRGRGPVDYAAQPFYPDAPALPAGGVHLVYLKVWQRDVTAVEDPRIVEPALGVDTTTRLQTVWQVKVLPDAGNGEAVGCDTDPADVPGFAAAEPAAAARLTTGTADVGGRPDPCLVPVGGGYKGLENQLYRVEVHTGGDLSGANRATFKWSRDNGTVASRVSHIPALDRIVVESVGRDSELRFNDGDWIEVTDDWRELNGLPGEMRRIAAPGGVDDATRTVRLDSPLPAGMFPVDAQDRTTPQRNTRAQRWDQAGRVLDADGALHVDLDAATSTGVVPVVTGAPSVLLEHGVVVTFDLDGAGVLRTGDHWLFAARAVDASVEILDKAPPRGVHAHYATLATVTFPDEQTDLRECPPPPTPDGCCECDACVSVEDHASGALTIQDAVDAVVAAGGGTVCLDIGTYEVVEPVRIHDARGVRLRGKGWQTVLLAARGGRVVDVRNSTGVTVQDLAVLTTSPDDRTTAIALTRCVAVTVEDCAVQQVSGQGIDGVAVELDGYQLDTTVRRCTLAASTGLSAGAGDGSTVTTASLRVIDNRLLCRRRGIELERFTLHLTDTRIAGNLVLGCDDAGLVAVGGNDPGGALDIADNLCEVPGTGIVVGVDNASITGNDVRGRRSETPGDGIALVPGIEPRGMAHCLVLGNRVGGVSGHGITIRTRVESGMIKHNVVAETGGGGIVMEAGGSAGTLVVENNQLLRVTGAMRRSQAHVGMLLLSVDRLDVTDNVVDEFAREVTDSLLRSAIVVVASRSMRLGRNRVSGIAPPVEYAGPAIGLHVIPPFGTVEATGNRVGRRQEETERVGSGQWIGVLVGTPGQEEPRFFTVGDVAVASSHGRSYVMTGTHLRAAVRSESGDLALLGNTVYSEASELPPVLVRRARGVRFSDNQVLRTDAERGEPSLLRCARAVVSANDLRDRLDDGAVLRVEITGQGSAAIIGNLVSSPITLNGNPVPMDILNPFCAE